MPVAAQEWKRRARVASAAGWRTPDKNFLLDRADDLGAILLHSPSDVLFQGGVDRLFFVL
jgi:hypothetical protein